MIIEINDWKFQVFDVATRKYYAREAAEHCNCAYCRNFYAAVDCQYPDLRSFLARFGVHIEAPDEMMSFTPTTCSNYYAVCGRILEQGSEPITVGGVTVEPETAEQATVNTRCPEPYFLLYTGVMTLPWVLDEPMEEANSPAKDSNPITRLLSRWITNE